MGTARLETLIDYAGRGVDAGIRCRRCKRIRMVPIETLAEVLGWTTRIADAERRLKCTHCGHKGAKMAPVPRIER